MGLSKSAKRGIAILNHLQSRPKNQKYHTKKMMIKVGPPQMEPNVFAAAITAQELINAKLQVIPYKQGNAIAPDAEVRPEHDVRVQPEAGEKATEGTQGGPQ